MIISAALNLFERTLPLRRQLCFVSPPGVGKTVGKMETALRLGWDYIGICAPLTDPAFWMGYPYRNGDRAGFAPFAQLAQALKATKPTFLDIDEVGGISESVAKALLRFVQFREVGEQVLPDCVTLGFSSNDVSHGAGVMGLIEPLKDRMDSIVNIEPNLDDTIVYGLSRGWPTDVLAFLRNDPSSLHDWAPVRSMQVGGATPRGWEAVARWINQGIDDREVICGKVGKGAGTKYLAFRDLMADLPDIDGVLMNPDTAPLPDNPGARFLIASTLSARVTAGNFGQVVTYLRRMPQTIRAFSIRDAFRAEDMRKRDGRLPKDWKPLMSSRDFTAFAVSDDGKDILSAAK